MKQFLKTASLLFSIVLGLYAAAGAQQGTLFHLKENLKTLEQQEDYQKDTAWANTVNKIAFIYADSYPDSALAILDGHAERCHAAGYLQGETEVYKINGNAWQTI